MTLPPDIEREIRSDSIRKGVNWFVFIFLILTAYHFWLPALFEGWTILKEFFR